MECKFQITLHSQNAVCLVFFLSVVPTHSFNFFKNNESQWDYLGIMEQTHDIN